MGRHAAPEPAPLELPPARRRLPVVEALVFAPVVGVVAALLMRWSGATWSTSWTGGAGIGVFVVLAAWLTRWTPGQILDPDDLASRTPPENPPSGEVRTP